MSVINAPTLQDRLLCALNNQNILTKCSEISNILQDVSNKDGGVVLRSIVESVFGVSSILASTQSQSQQLGEGWGLRVITLTEHNAEFQAMRAFLSPNGPLLNLVYRLSHDPFQLIPFPISLFPMMLRCQIESGSAGSFYAGKIQNAAPGKTPQYLLFNAFEYYMFHFGYFVVGERSQNWNILWNSVKDSLYPTLLEDYLSSYLPCTAASPPGPSAAIASPRGLLSPISQGVMSPVNHPFRTMDGTLLHSQGFQTSSPVSSAASQVEVSTWTSQVLVQVLMEIWINFCMPSDSNFGAHTSPHHMRSISPSLEDVFVPSADHVRAVRMVVKHLHYFSNSIKLHYPSPLDSLRRNIWVMCRKGVYFFIKHLLIHWPLDSSFRICLETWLSFIQPWRYTSYLSSDWNGSQDIFEMETPRRVEGKWSGFFAQNLLFYSLFFRILVQRILKLDLTSPKNAQILFRVTKVFGQENFSTIIEEIEELWETNQTQKGFAGLMGGVGGPLMTPDKSDSVLLPQQIVQMVRSHIVDTEKPHHVYMPLFGQTSIKEVYQLIILSSTTKDNLKVDLNLLTGSRDAAVEKSSGWLHYLYRTLMSGDPSEQEENSVEETKKCIIHLELSVSHLCAIFNITAPESLRIDPRSGGAFSGDTPRGGTPEKVRIPELTMTDNGPQLTELGRHQLMNGMRRIDLKYEGDPDLRPIGDLEVGVLVRVLYHLCRFINTKYGSSLTRCYHRRDYFGSLSRLFLQPPQTIQEYQRDSKDFDFVLRRLPRDLPPRLSLRAFARKKFLFYAVVLYLVMYLFGFSFSRTTFQLVLPFAFTYILVKAVLNHTMQSSDPQR